MLTFFAFLIFTPLILFLTFFLTIQIFKILQKPKLKRDWYPLFSKLPNINLAHIHSTGEIFIKNVRNTKYSESESVSKVNYTHKKYNLSNIKKLWVFVAPYGPLQSHIIFSFEFGSEHTPASFLTISYELRKTNILDFNIYKTLFTNFEGFYLVATEEDVIYLRTSIRKDGDVYLYPLDLSKDQVKRVFLNLCSEINTYETHPKFYRILHRNCLTEMLKHLKNEKLLKYNFLKLLNVNRLIFKSHLIQKIKDREVSLDSFKETHKIKVSHDLNLDTLQEGVFSFLVRKGQ